MDRIASLIEGYEDAYGMELLSTVHWVMCHEPKVRESKATTISAIRHWNSRKRDLLQAEHVEKAWERLKTLRWDIESRSAMH
jgi:hypothetical protein